MNSACFVCGSRVKLEPEVSNSLLSGQIGRPSFFSMPLGYALNSLRIGPLRSYFATRYHVDDIQRLRGSNMAFWRSDVVRVNGFNEDLVQWGHEDAEFALRLYNSGVQKRALKFGGVQYHIYHKPQSTANEQSHYDAIKNVVEYKISRCENGIDKYLTSKP